MSLIEFSCPEKHEVTWLPSYTLSSSSNHIISHYVRLTDKVAPPTQQFSQANTTLSKCIAT